MVSSEDASIQKTWENLDVLVIRSEIVSEETYLPAISSTNFKQICVFPIPPIPYNKNDFLHLSPAS